MFPRLRGLAVSEAVYFNKVRTYELQSDEHEEGVKENLDFRFGILVCISFLRLGFSKWWHKPKSGILKNL